MYFFLNSEKSNMNLEKLFGSKTKVDILKYLIFRRQWVSMRALETELWWTFPAIKKQIDSLNDAWIILIDKENTWWSIHLKPGIEWIFRELFFEALKQNLAELFENAWEKINCFFWWDKFWKEIGMDLLIIHNNMEQEDIAKLKEQINDCFRDCRIETASIATMSADEWDTRRRLTDRFFLKVMKYYNNIR